MAKKNEETAQPETDAYEQYAGRGLENAPPAPIPVLKIVHGNEKDFAKPGTPLENAKAGQILFTGNGALMDAAWVTPLHVMRYFGEWTGTYKEDGELVRRLASRPENGAWIPKRGLVLPNKNIAVESRVFYVIVDIPGDALRPAAVYFQRTNIKESAYWLQVMRQVIRRPDGKTEYIPPVFAKRYALSTQRMEDAENAWWVWKVSPEFEWNLPFGELFQQCVASLPAVEDYAHGLLLSTNVVEGETQAGDDMPF